MDTLYRADDAYRHTIRSITIVEASQPEHFDAARVLFGEYFGFLDSLPDTGLIAEMQHVGTELAELETGAYTPPHGAILLALQEEYVGVVALRKFTEGICEMKRLYVRPGSRGASVGVQLARRIVQVGRKMGYRKMRLDSHPAMTQAQRLYYALGFHDIPKYNQNEVPGAKFMASTYSSSLGLASPG